MPIRNDQGAVLFPDGWDEPKSYLRVVTRPS